MENTGVRLELFLKEFSKLASAPYGCSSTLRDEVIAASFKNQSVDVVKAQLAAVVHGTWQEKDGSWTLIQSDEQKKEEIGWHRELQRVQIQNTIDWAKKYLPTAEWTIADSEKYQRDLAAATSKTAEHVATAAERRALRAREPVFRFASTLFSRMNPSMFPLDRTECGSMHYLVSAGQESSDLGINITDILGRYDRESLLGKATGDNPASARVAITMNDSSNITFSFELLDRDGRSIRSGSPVPFQPIAYYRPKGEVFPHDLDMQKRLDAYRYTLTDRAKTNSEVREEMDKKVEYYSDEADAVFKGAVDKDPLSLLQGPLWIDFAKYQKKPLLVNLSEVYDASIVENGIPTLNQDHEVIGMTRVDGDGWILGRPIDPLSNRAKRFDRRLLVRFVELQSKEEQATIEEQLELCAIRTAIDVDSVGIPNERIGSLSTNGAYMYPNGSVLGEAMRQGVFPNRDGLLPVSRLPARARKYLYEEFLVGSLNKLSKFSEDDYSRYPTFALPKGIDHMVFKVTSSMRPGFEMSTGQGEKDVFDLRRFSRTIMDVLDEGKMLNVPLAKFAYYRNWNVQLFYDDKSVDEDFDDYPKNFSQISSWNGFPSDVKKQVLDMIKKLKDDDEAFHFQRETILPSIKMMLEK